MAGFGENQPAWHETNPEQLLTALLSTSTVGVAICDRQLRFRAINGALASMNGVPPAAHIGKTIHQILGTAAANIEPAFQHVLATGDPVSNFAVTAQLLHRPEAGHWIENYYPIRDGSQKVVQVGVVVVEVTKRKNVEQSLNRLTINLHQAAKALSHRERLRRAPKAQQPASVTPLDLLKNCISETRKISESLRPELRLAGNPHDQMVFQPAFDSASSAHTHLPPGSLPAAPDPASRLSQRERQVVKLLVEGKSNKEMAAILNLSIRTIETYRARVMLKLDLHTVAQLVRYALHHQII